MPLDVTATLSTSAKQYCGNGTKKIVHKYFQILLTQSGDKWTKNGTHSNII